MGAERPACRHLHGHAQVAGVRSARTGNVERRPVHRTETAIGQPGEKGHAPALRQELERDEPLVVIEGQDPVPLSVRPFKENAVG